MSGLQMFKSHSVETPWEWAKARRTWFTTPKQDAVAGVVTGIATAILDFFLNAGSSLGRSIVAGVFVGVIGGVLMPFLEAVVWLVRRKAVMLEEAQGVDASTATFADARPLFGFAHGHLFEHRRDQ